MHCIIPYIDTLNVQNSCLTGQNCNLAVIVASLSCNGRLVVLPGECKGMRRRACCYGWTWQPYANMAFLSKTWLQAATAVRSVDAGRTSPLGRHKSSLWNSRTKQWKIHLLLVKIEGRKSQKGNSLWWKQFSCHHRLKKGDFWPRGWLPSLLTWLSLLSDVTFILEFLVQI